MSLVYFFVLTATPEIESKTTVEEITIAVVSGLILMLITGIVAYIKGKRLSIDAINRKISIYIPLINQLLIMEQNTIESTFNVDFVMDVVKNNYKYAISKKVYKNLSKLLDLINEFEDIRIESVAHRIIVESFVEVYERKFGTIIDGISFNSTIDGDEYEIEEEVPELSNLKHYLNPETLKKLIANMDMDQYILNLEENDYVYINEDLVNIFDIAFNSSFDGREPNKLIIEGWNGSLAEYMAYNIDFQDKFNDDMYINRKVELLKKILTLSDNISNDLKTIVNKIVKKYEKEVV